MDRPARKSKVINYCDLDDDEDFASSKPPASKKPREEIKPVLKKPLSKSSSQDLHPQPSANHSDRKPPDQKLYERDLEAALTLSLLHGTKDCHVDLSPTTSLTPTLHTEQYPTMGLSPTADLSPTTEAEDGRRGEEREDPSPLLFSNCSVNGNLMGLDNIQAERGSSKVKSSPRTGEPPRGQNPDQDPDEDYKPRLTPESESDDNSSGVAESEDEEFTVRKVIKKSKKETKKTKTSPPRPPPQTSSKRDKLTSKAAKAKPPATASTPVRAAASTPLRTPPSVNQGSGSRRPPPPSAASPPCVPAASPAGGSKVSKWNPPGQLGSSPSPSQGSALRSPAGGVLRLGLSRRVRVKPLHPSVASH
ncbi:RAD51-associated protein 1 isoform X1 [Gadus chalcogrammus]|uniref:RAD51-associated protein 1 isoform X1 n=1 Tax=Gadus chalcogrammus TaxID=1042646 RepID=UPI0024C4E22B|nr:RAD51-associated protein 1 isoform X1 [Gadus chalcogrammus]